MLSQRVVFFFEAMLNLFRRERAADELRDAIISPERDSERKIVA
jgi:hypothetical protein